MIKYESNLDSHQPFKRKAKSMSTEEIFAIGRVVERLMVCAFAGLSLTYGWNLFRIGVLNEQSAELSEKSWRLNLKRVGPGAFFALFGCVILAISVKSPLSLPPSTKTENYSAKTAGPGNGATGAATSPSPIVYVEGEDASVAKRWVASLNTILVVAKPDKFPSATEQKVIRRTDDDLETLRNALIIRQFGAPLLGEYKAYREQVLQYNTPGTADQQKKFAQIGEWMQGTRIEE